MFLGAPRAGIGSPSPFRCSSGCPAEWPTPCWSTLGSREFFLGLWTVLPWTNSTSSRQATVLSIEVASAPRA